LESLVLAQKQLLLAQERSEQRIAALTEELREQRQAAGLGTNLTSPASGFDAGNRPTNAFELPEILPLELPNETALVAQSGNRQFKSVGARCGLLQRKLFFETERLLPTLSSILF